jgi:hypothetical protein
MTKLQRPVLLIAALGMSQAASAQMSMPSITSALPNVSSITVGNAAGVLQYCMKNNLVSTSSAGAVLDGLGKTPNLTKSSDYAAGQSGRILTGQGEGTSIAGLQPYLKSQACSRVLEQAKTFH